MALRRWLGTIALAVSVLGGTVAGPVRAAEPQDVVQTGSGAVKGVATAGYRAFHGIPYAKPPLGDLRWRPPQPPAAWTGVRDATGNRTVRCPQHRLSYEPDRPMTEDCLVVDVYTPPGATDADRLPVMVWLHGGGFENGSGADFNAAGFVARADAVVVSVTYRLGALGFLALPGLRAEDPKLNYGLQDQQEALRWVHRNIAAFGGDAGRVTLFGESAGALSTCAHLTIPSSAGLFHRAIMQSGPCEDSQVHAATLAAAEKHGAGFADKAGCPDGPDRLACLRALPAADLVAAAPPLDDPASVQGVPWAPVVDGTFLPGDPADLVRAGKFTRMPVMIGINREEGRLFTALFRLKTDHDLTETEYRAQLDAFGGPLVGGIFALLYPSERYGSPERALAALLTDMMFAHPVQGMASAFSDRVPTFAYEFNEPKAPSVIPTLPDLRCACHASEILYLLDPDSARYDAAQKALADQMIRTWGTFAATGSPTSTTLPAWPGFNRLSSPYRNLNSAGEPDVTRFGAFQNVHQDWFWALVSPFLT
ncbi:carboxylesterase/lipase family protein [Actinomadura rayongensis]|uniref:Carboxylic ester hydrolase n=1 Tax=Actinomadura rayongensis TaxID=1429076 RepID=A0A6I4WLA5_9ACTN|nr:carboxylesterase family protein [Actinomadura rayongensis]MXQ67402.1 carboxylesterase family protein [Actinomadura rayongensis]